MGDSAVLSSQQTILEQYFKYLASFTWDRAKELVEKERDCQRHQHNQSSILSSMMTALAQLALADKNYVNLNFLVPKGFLRKDVVRGMYETLRSEFERLHERGHSMAPEPRQSSTPTTPTLTSPQSPSPAPSSHTTLSTTTSSSSSILSIAASISSALISPSSLTTMGSAANSQSLPNSPIKATLEVLDRLAAHICGQLFHYVRARMEMMDVYEKITVVSGQKFCVLDECIASLSDVMAANQRHFHHPLLCAIKTGFTLECDALMALMKAQTDIQNLAFLRSLFDLHEAQTKLSTWAQISLNRDSPQRRNSLLRTTVIPPLYQWLCRIKSSLISKYSLYFYHTLSKQVTTNCPNDVKTVCGKQSIDFIQKITTFQRKMDAQFVSLLFDTHGCDDYTGFGYHSPYRPFESPKGIDSFPVIVSYPCEVSKTHLPPLIMTMNNKSKELNGSDAVVSLFDPQLNSTYFLIRPDPRITLTVIFESKKSEKDNYVCAFLQDMCAQLRANKVFASLKPGK